MSDPEPISSQRRHNTRLGLILFCVYLALYLIFVLLNAFKADVMDTIVLAGLNLAIVYGFALIVVGVGVGADLRLHVPQRTDWRVSRERRLAMIYEPSGIAVGVFMAFVLGTVGLSFIWDALRNHPQATLPRTAKFLGWSMGLPLPVTTCRPHRSWASAA